MMRKSLIVVLIGVGVLGACKKEQPEQPAPVNTPPPAAPDTAGQGAARARADSIARENARREEEARRAAAMAEVRSALTEMVFFDYDQSEIRADMQDVLSRKAAALRANPNVSLRIDGHADERGSDEYNLALSKRRAAEAKRFLVQQGVEAGRLEVEGYGEEQPLDPANNEAAWALNRRAGFQVTGGKLSQR